MSRWKKWAMSHLGFCAAPFVARSSGGRPWTWRGSPSCAHFDAWSTCCGEECASTMTTATWLTFSNPRRAFRRCQRLRRSNSRIERWCLRSTTSRSCIIRVSAVVGEVSFLGKPMFRRWSCRYRGVRERCAE